MYEIFLFRVLLSFFYDGGQFSEHSRYTGTVLIN